MTTTAKVNQILKFTLDENPTTGYSWILAVSPGLEIISDRYIQPNNNLVGAGGKHEWTIKTIDEGLQMITGLYIRPWETSSNAAKTCIRLVNVQ